MKIDPDNDENDNDDSSSSQTSVRISFYFNHNSLVIISLILFIYFCQESSKSAQIKTFTCKTVVGKVLKLNFQWKIENFEDCWWTYQPGSALESPKFSLRDDKKDEWYFQLFPRGTNKHRGNLIMYINLTIQPFHQLPKDFLAGGISMKINFGGIESPPTTSLLIEKCTENEFACVLDTKTTNYPRLFSTWCSKGTLLITADITGKTTTQKIYDEEFRTQDLEKWRGKNIFITFDVDGRQFKANRVHFEEASPVFYELINKQLSKKNTQNIITISDVKSKIFKQILDFINNSEEFTLNQSLVEDLLMAADLFELNKLKKICEKNICRNITIDNACRTLVLAHENKANKLKEEAIYLINANLQTIVYTSEYRNMAQYHPEVAEMLRKAKPLDHKIILLTNK